MFVDAPAAEFVSQTCRFLNMLALSCLSNAARSHFAPNSLSLCLSQLIQRAIDKLFLSFFSFGVLCASADNRSAVFTNRVFGLFEIAQLLEMTACVELTEKTGGMTDEQLWHASSLMRQQKGNGPTRNLALMKGKR